MSTPDLLKEHFKLLGFDGEIPEDLSHICNPSTYFIWDQVISKIRSKNKVENIRKTIIVNRLSEYSLNENDEYLQPMDEIERYKTKCKLEEKVPSLQQKIAEKKAELEALVNHNKQTYITIQHKKEKLKERRQKTFLINKKVEVLKNIEGGKCADILAAIKNCTSKETVKQDSELNVLFSNCVEDLKPSINKVSTAKFKQNLSNLMDFTFLTNTQRSFEQWKTSTQIKNCAQDNKENYSQFFTSSPSEHNSKRESLGLLPDTCFNNDTEDNSFLSATNNRLNLPKTPKKNNILKSVSEEKKDNIERLFENQKINEVCLNLLRTTNEHCISNYLNKTINQRLIKLEALVSECNSIETSRFLLSDNDLSVLYFSHVKNELLKLKHQKQTNLLQEQINQRKAEIFDKNLRLDQNQLQLKIDKVKLNASLLFLKRELSTSINASTDEAMDSQMKNIDREFKRKQEHIKVLAEMVQKIFEVIRTNNEEREPIVREVFGYFQDLEWAEELKQNVYTNEIATFQEFPLEFHQIRKTKFYTAFGKFPSSMKILASIELDYNLLTTFSIIFDKPDSSVVDTLQSLIEEKKYLEKLKALPDVPQAPDNFDSSLVNLLSDEKKKLKEHVVRIEAILVSDAVSKLEQAPNRMKKMMSLWIDMPLRKYVAEDKLVNGKTYKEYERSLEKRNLGN